MNLSEVSIRKPVFAWMLMTSMILFGSICYFKMGVSALPDVDFPVVNISLSLEGAAPEIMEVDVVDPVESALMSIQGITSITSSSKTGSANVTLEFELDKNIDVAVQEVQTVLSQVARKLPKDLDPPAVNKTNPEDQPILWLAVTSPQLSQRDLMTLVRDQVKNKFTTVPGVAEINLGGYIEPNLRVWLSSKKLSQYDLTVADILDTIQQEHSEQPAGRVEGADKEWNIRTMGEAPSPEDFGKLTINKRGGAPNYVPILLDQVAQIEDGLTDVRSRSRSNGKASIGLGIKKQRGSNAVKVAALVKEKLVEVQKLLPSSVEIEVRNDSTEFIRESVNELVFTLILSAILTAIVCWGFLGSLSATLNVVLAIPTSVIGAFVILYALGFTLNTFTLLGLSLAIGIVVDDAIMVLENIVRHKEEGKSRREAALMGSKEITFAALAATVAIIAIFLPVAFMKGIIGKYFYQFGVTLSISVLLSLVEALTLTPMRCAEFLQVSERHSSFGRSVEWLFAKSAQGYKQILTQVLNYRWTTLAGAILFFTGTFVTVKYLKKEFVPPQDQSRLLLRLQTPVGSSLNFTDAKFKEVEELFKTVPEVSQYFGTVGGFGGSGTVNMATVFLVLKPVAERRKNPKTNHPYTQQELIPVLRNVFKQVKDTKIVIQDLSLSGFTAKRGFPVEFTVQGPEWDKIIESSQAMMKEMEASGIMTDVDSNYDAGLPEVRVIPDRVKAKQRGVSISDVGITINALMGGVVAGKFSKNGHRYDVRVRLLPGERGKIQDIKKLFVRNNRGEVISLSEVVRLEEVKALQSISRQDRERAISVFANIAETSSQSKAIEKVQEIAGKVLPPGYHIVVSGSAKTFKESFESLIFALILGILVSYMVLASQFNSFIHPITVLMALPFSVSGAFVALYIKNQSLNIYSMIGLILLMGIVKKNSILLVDFTNQVREQGHSVKDAILKACPVRLRPILMTSVATIAGAIPPALALGPGAESRIPMALAVIGGVLVSTFLTLFVVPVVYSLFSREKAVAVSDKKAV